MKISETYCSDLTQNQRQSWVDEIVAMFVDCTYLYYLSSEKILSVTKHSNFM